MLNTQRVSSTSRASISPALSFAAAASHSYATHSTHTAATANAGKFWATKNFAAYGLRGTWSSIR